MTFLLLCASREGTYFLLMLRLVVYYTIVCCFIEVCKYGVRGVASHSIFMGQGLRLLLILLVGSQHLINKSSFITGVGHRHRALRLRNLSQVRVDVLQSLSNPWI